MTQIDIAPAPSLGSVRCTPAPSWAKHGLYAVPPDATADRYIDEGVCRLLQDTQVNLCVPGSALYQRKVQCVLTRAGAERASHFAVEFDPSCEAVEIHVVRILRSGETIDHAAADRVQIFRRETNLERLALNGRLTASLLIPDVRIGDIVETALTISGRNPALGEKFAGWAVFDDTLPWFEYRYRCLRPAGRTIAVRSFRTPPPLQISVEDGVEEVHCTLVGPPRREVEELALPWLVNAPALQFSEFQSWGEVSCLFAPYYATGTLPDSVATVVDRVRDEHKTAGDRAAAWLRFVQREVRYFALSLGEGGYVPRQLGEIWGSRFGDCKDAAQLYVAGARRLGIDACAALTSTTHGQGLAELLPAPILFNHCIVRLRLDGQTYWLDPTMPQQGGGLARIFQPHSGWALALSGQDDDLESMNGQETPIHYLNVEEEVEFEAKPTNPARLRRQYEYYSWAADQIRNAFADGGSSDYTREKLKELQAVWPQVREAGAIVIQDDPVDNCLTTILCYEIPDCWTPLPDKRLQFAIQDIPVAAGLAPLKLSQRTTDIYLGRPRKVSHRIRLKMPRKWAGEGWYQDKETAGLAFANRLKVEGHFIVNERSLTVDGWSFPAGQAKDYDDVVSATRQNSLSIWVRQRFGRIRPTVSIGFGFNFGTFYMIVVGLMFLSFLMKAFSQH